MNIKRKARARFSLSLSLSVCTLRGSYVCVCVYSLSLGFVWKSARFQYILEQGDEREHERKAGRINRGHGQFRIVGNATDDDDDRRRTLGNRSQQHHITIIDLYTRTHAPSPPSFLLFFFFFFSFAFPLLMCLSAVAVLPPSFPVHTSAGVYIPQQQQSSSYI